MLSLSRRRKLDLERIRGSSRQPKRLLNTLIGHQAQDADSRGTRELTREICECTGNAAGYGNDTGFRVSEISATHASAGFLAVNSVRVPAAI